VALRDKILNPVSMVLRALRPTDVGTLDQLLAHASPKAPYAERIEWLVSVVRWVTRRGPTGLEGVPGVERRHPATTRLHYALAVLERNPPWKTAVARTLRSIVRDLDALELFCETGLPREASFVNEAFERVWLRLLPSDPYRAELGTVLVALFPDESQAEWLESLDDDALERVGALLAHDEAEDTQAGRPWNPMVDDVPDALLLLTSELRATGLSTSIRKRIAAASFRDLPFFGLTRAAEEVVAAARQSPGALADAAARLEERLNGCAQALDQARDHLDEFGVSVRIVYQLERMDAQIRRTRTLVAMLGDGRRPAFVAAFLARLVRDTQGRRQLSVLFETNTRLLAQKVVDRSAETGEHYIARTREQYRESFRSAAGGGLVIVGTVFGKFLALAAGLAPFVQGVLVSFNYAASFVLMQLSHFTLATKQPATTAPALAARMQAVDTEAGLKALVDEIVHLLRSQMASVLGNLVVVVPGVALVALASIHLLGLPPIGPEKADKLLAEHALVGATPLFAAITGVLLFVSSVAAGTADNWFVLRGIGPGIARSRRLAFVFGRRFPRELAAFLKTHVSGLAGNVALGTLLGMTPELLMFLGLPLDVRHVTISSGKVAAAVATLGPAVLLELRFWHAAAGLAAAGLFNVGVSFALALWLAIRARGVEAPQRHALWGALGARLRQRPRSFLFPDSD
jgi:site-specific recombinase